jgi:hypothetical protein
LLGLAAYKRFHLLVAEPERAVSLLHGERPVQLLLAGTAHPQDENARQGLQLLFRLKEAPDVAGRVAFLEDYDLGLAQAMVSGCDVWVNLPRSPLEASGTSGMKAAINGALNLSVLEDRGPRPMTAPTAGPSTARSVRTRQLRTSVTAAPSTISSSTRSSRCSTIETKRASPEAGWR